MKKIILLFITLSLLTGCVSVNVDKNSKNEKTEKEEVKTEIKEEVIEEKEEETITTITEETKTVEEITNNDILTEEDKNDLKNTFIKLTDFIFYDGEINGTTFDELSENAKNYILKMYEAMDSKIENKVPGYKDDIKDFSKKELEEFKKQSEKLQEDFKSKYIEKFGEEGYEKFEEKQEEIKGSIVKGNEELKGFYESAKQEADNWYQDFKNGEK